MTNLSRLFTNPVLVHFSVTTRTARHHLQSPSTTCCVGSKHSRQIIIIIIIIIIQYLYSAVKSEDTDALGGAKLREVK